MAEDSGRVVGPNARSPGCNDAFCYILFWLMAIMCVVFFFTWVGDGAEGFPSENIGLIYTNGTATELGSASVLTAFYGLLFSILWVFLYFAVLRVAAYVLIMGINMLMIALWLIFGACLIVASQTCKDWTVTTATPLGPVTTATPCDGTSQALMVVGGILLVACGVLHALWLCCIRARIFFTAKILEAVSGVLSECPGTVVVGLIVSVVGCFWYVLWYGAFIQMSNYIADGQATDGVPSLNSQYWGSWIGMLFGMLICLFWGQKVCTNTAHMVSAHVVAAWYFDKDTAGVGLPCCRPTTCLGVKRALWNYFGSIAFGSLIVAILEAVYWTLKIVLDQATKGQNFVIKLVACCILCCINCIKNTVEWLTEWAYCYIAVTGCGFVSAGGKVAKMLGESGMGAIAQSTLVAPVLMVGKLLGAAAGVGGGFLTLQSFTTLDHDYIQPLLGALVAFAVASISFACLDAGNKCMFVCYIEEPELMAQRVPALNEAFGADERNKVSEYKKGGGSGNGTANTQGVDVVVRP